MTAGDTTKPAPKGGLAYRPDLDGLRAVAVLLVVLSHSSVIGFAGGGRVGYHVFFVLSGFLITTLLIREQRAGGIGLRRFYVRRIRRLVPGLVFMVAVVFGLGVLLGKGPDIAGAALLSILYASNVASTCGSPAVFCHTWTLAVEEQFYLIWPVLLMLAFRGRAWGIGVIVATAVLVWFLPGFWALEIGCAAAFLVDRFGSPRFTAPLGVLLIATGVPSLVDGPGLIAVCLGAALVIVDRMPVLEARPLVELGKVSYGVYLWQTPIIVTAFTVLPPRTEAANVVMQVLVIALSILAGALSTRYVEARFRKPRNRRDDLVGARSEGQAFQPTPP